MEKVIEWRRNIYIYILATILFSILGMAKIDAYAMYYSEGTYTNTYNDTYDVYYFTDDYGQTTDHIWIGSVFGLSVPHYNHYKSPQVPITSGSCSAVRGKQYGYDSFEFNINNINVDAEDRYLKYWTLLIDVETTDGRHACTVYNSGEYSYKVGSTMPDYYLKTGDYRFLGLYATPTSLNFDKITKAISGYVRVVNHNRMAIKKVSIYLGRTGSTGWDYDGFHSSGVGSCRYAKIGELIKGYDIKFNVNGGSQTISNQVAENITLPNPGTRAGYTFDGWYNGDTKIGDTGDIWKPTADATITAHWTPITYTIRYVLYGGEVSGNPETYTIETPTFTLNNPTQDNQTFTGWTDAGKVGTKASNISESTEPKTSFQIVKGQYGDRVFTANWKSASWKDASGTGNVGDADKADQKRDTTESKVKRNRIKIG